MLRYLVNQALGNKILELRATYIPTAKNNMVREHYDRLGFTLLAEDEQGVRSYSFDTASYVEDDLYLNLVWEG
jgi:predicted enzyme involved in methoxymalonyl-ACP biosynthesis